VIRKKAAPARYLSRRALGISVSSTVAVAQRAAALKAAGEDVLDFSVGEPDQPTPEHVKAAAVAALGANRTRYTAAAGIPELRAAIAMRYREDFGVAFAPEEVAVTMGGKQALYLAGQALLDRGDEVVIPVPHWPTFSEAVRLAGGRPVAAETREEDGFRVTARLVGKAVTSRTKAVLVNSPGNPTGAVIGDAELQAIANLARRKKFTILYDDTYARMVFADGDAPDLAAARERSGGRLVILGTASKSFCMTGWRIGWILGPRPLVDAAAALVSHSTQCPTSFAQAGAVAALTGPQGFVAEQTREYRRRRDALHAALVAIPGVRCALPGGAFYLFPNVERHLSRRRRDSVALASALLEEARVAVVPGEAFYGPGHLRLSFARPMAELQDGARRIAAFLARGGGD
jgi:aspartate aminotransferase